MTNVAPYSYNSGQDVIIRHFDLPETFQWSKNTFKMFILILQIHEHVCLSSFIFPKVYNVFTNTKGSAETEVGSN